MENLLKNRAEKTFEYNHSKYRFKIAQFPECYAFSERGYYRLLKSNREDKRRVWSGVFVYFTVGSAYSSMFRIQLAAIIHSIVHTKTGQLQTMQKPVTSGPCN